MKLRINGIERDFNGDSNMPTLWYLRDELGLVGTKYGCGVGLCGACTVHVDGLAQFSCLVRMGELEGKSVTTIEGLSEDGQHPIQVAWRDQNVPQCGFCQPGQIMKAASLLKEIQKPTDQEILEGMSGNVCRCGCYERIVAAVRQASTGA
ncbi:MAG: (2Fe-2S)-binding protein [Hyphomicrobium sp.]|nr:(2Fe-2S)-binding protein [Hyphomicrobium sp.]